MMSSGQRVRIGEREMAWTAGRDAYRLGSDPRDMPLMFSASPTLRRAFLAGHVHQLRKARLLRKSGEDFRCHRIAQAGTPYRAVRPQHAAALARVGSAGLDRADLAADLFSTTADEAGRA